MAILNVTPDSFSDGGLHAESRSALERAQACVEQGADILDVGGESTRPGAAAVSVEEEWQRLEPVLRELVRWPIAISVDTRRTEIMHRSLDLGVDIINDVQALQAPGALDLLARHAQAGVCLMHMRGEPRDMQSQTDYTDVVQEVTGWLKARCRTVLAAGVNPDRVVVDPGIGFSKTPGQNLALLARQPELLQVGRPLLIGWSRKSTLGLITGRSEPRDRVAASVAAATLALGAGASILRVHDVGPTVDALKVWEAVQQSRSKATIADLVQPQQTT